MSTDPSHFADPASPKARKTRPKPPAARSAAQAKAGRTLDRAYDSEALSARPDGSVRYGWHRHRPGEEEERRETLIPPELAQLRHTVTVGYLAGEGGSVPAIHVDDRPRLLALGRDRTGLADEGD